MNNISINLSFFTEGNCMPVEERVFALFANGECCVILEDKSFTSAEELLAYLREKNII